MKLQILQENKMLLGKLLWKYSLFSNNKWKHYPPFFFQSITTNMLEVKQWIFSISMILGKLSRAVFLN